MTFTFPAPFPLSLPRPRRPRLRRGVVGAVAAAAIITSPATAGLLAGSPAAADPPPTHLPTASARSFLLLGGDWNAGPTVHGKFSPSWVAKQTALRITAPPRGGGRIDYAMSNARVGHVRRIAGGGSDHGLIAFRTANPDTGQRLRGATFNVQRDRSRTRVSQLVGYLQHTARRHKLDYLLLQESADYHPALRRVRGFHLVGTTRSLGASYNVVLVRDHVRTTHEKFRAMSPSGWTTVRGGEHPPTYTTFVTLGGWLRVASVHEGVSVRWSHGRLGGPPRRVADRKASARKLVHVAHHYSARAQRRAHAQP